ncbi:MAG: hypothetical protein AAFO02_23825, partial [Bacteroidota bacterium]
SGFDLHLPNFALFGVALWSLPALAVGCFLTAPWSEQNFAALNSNMNPQQALRGTSPKSNNHLLVSCLNYLHGPQG